MQLGYCSAIASATTVSFLSATSLPCTGLTDSDICFEGFFWKSLDGVFIRYNTAAISKKDIPVIQKISVVGPNDLAVQAKSTNKRLEATQAMVTDW